MKKKNKVDDILYSFKVKADQAIKPGGKFHRDGEFIGTVISVEPKGIWQEIFVSLNPDIAMDIYLQLVAEEFGQQGEEK